MSHFNRKYVSRGGRLSVWIYLMLLLWFSGIGVCVTALSRYESTPSPMQVADGSWPSSSSLEFQPGVWNLVMFVHPRCPCSHASMMELINITKQVNDCHSLSARVVFYQPSDEPTVWGQTAIRQLAENSESLQVISDLNGVMARDFQAESSGLVHLYTPSGELVFAGGITPGRGQSGTSQGSEIITKLVFKQSVEPNVSSSSEYSPVYGCAIYDAETMTQSRCEDGE